MVTVGVDDQNKTDHILVHYWGLHIHINFTQYIKQYLNSHKQEYVASSYTYLKNPKYANVFVLTNTFKYAFVCCQRIYEKICSYLV